MPKCLKFFIIALCHPYEEQEKHFAARLREERKRANISQLDLAYKAKVSQNLVNFIETGKRIPTLHTILKICDALQINPAVLFREPDGDREEARKAMTELINRYF